MCVGEAIQWGCWAAGFRRAPHLARALPESSSPLGGEEWGLRRYRVMAKARRQRLKVFRTPIGFHDAYVAAPSQKAALEAWGANTNLFAQGAAEQVTEPNLTKVPLKHPGEVIKVLRGNEAAQLKALGGTRSTPAGKKEDGSRIKSGMTKRRGPKPTRAKVGRAEEALQKLDAAHAKELEGLRDQEQVLARKLREAHRAYREKRAALEEKADAARADYDAALRNWELK